MNIQSKSGAAQLSIISNTLLVLLKLVVGMLTGSISVLSEAVHSAVDLIASGVAFFSIRAAEQPEDAEHPYGHGKIENLSAVVEAVLIFGAAGYILYEAYHRFFATHRVEGVNLAIGVMAISATANWGISQHLFRVARRTDSPALLADAHHLSVDVLTSAAVAATLVLIKLTHLPVLDPAIAVLVALLIVKVAWGLTREAGGALLDEALPEDERERLKAVLDAEPRALGYHRVRARKSGAQRHIDLHLLVDPELTLQEGHALAEKVEDDIREAFPGAWVVIHVEPATEEELAVQAGDPGIWKGHQPRAADQ